MKSDYCKICDAAKGYSVETCTQQFMESFKTVQPNSANDLVLGNVPTMKVAQQSCQIEQERMQNLCHLFTEQGLCNN